MHSMMPIVWKDLKVGVQHMSGISFDEVFEYKSTLFKTVKSTNLSMAALMYSFRQTWTHYTLQCILALLNATYFDPQRKILHYLKTLEAPTYT